MITQEVRERIINHLNNSVSFTVICQKEKVKKHEVESVYNSIRKTPNSTLDSPTSNFQTVQADTITKQKASEEVEKLRLNLEILQEKNRNIDLQNKQVESKEITEREKMRLENSLEVRKLDLETKKFESEQKRQQVANLGQLKLESSAKEKKEIAALQKNINNFISQHFEELDDDLEVYIEKSACDKYLKVVKKLQSSYKKLFAGIDISETLHGIALDCLIEDLTCADDEDGNSLSYSDVEIFEDCLADGVELGDTEVAEQEEDD